MSTQAGPTICGPHPGYGLRVRKDGTKALAVADADCRCGRFAESATGDIETQNLVLRFERHRRDDCTLPDVRRAAALRDWRRRHPTRRK